MIYPKSPHSHVITTANLPYSMKSLILLRKSNNSVSQFDFLGSRVFLDIIRLTELMEFLPMPHVQMIRTRF